MLLVLINVYLQVTALVIGIPVMVVHEVVALNDVHTNLGTEHHLGTGLASDDGAHMLLEEHLHGDTKHTELVFTQIVKTGTEFSGSEIYQGGKSLCRHLCIRPMVSFN